MDGLDRVNRGGRVSLGNYSNIDEKLLRQKGGVKISGLITSTTFLDLKRGNRGSNDASAMQGSVSIPAPQQNVTLTDAVSAGQEISAKSAGSNDQENNIINSLSNNPYTNEFGYIDITFLVMLIQQLLGKLEKESSQSGEASYQAGISGAKSMLASADKGWTSAIWSSIGQGIGAAFSGLGAAGGAYGGFQELQGSMTSNQAEVEIQNLKVNPPMTGSTPCPLPEFEDNAPGVWQPIKEGEDDLQSRRQIMWRNMSLDDRYAFMEKNESNIGEDSRYNFEFERRYDVAEEDNLPRDSTMEFKDESKVPQDWAAQTESSDVNQARRQAEWNQMQPREKEAFYNQNQVNLTEDYKAEYQEFLKKGNLKDAPVPDFKEKAPPEWQPQPGESPEDTQARRQKIWQGMNDKQRAQFLENDSVSLTKSYQDKYQAWSVRNKDIPYEKSADAFNVKQGKIQDLMADVVKYKTSGIYGQTLSGFMQVGSSFSNMTGEIGAQKEKQYQSQLDAKAQASRTMSDFQQNFQQQTSSVLNAFLQAYGDVMSLLVKQGQSTAQSI